MSQDQSLSRDGCMVTTVACQTGTCTHLHRSTRYQFQIINYRLLYVKAEEWAVKPGIPMTISSDTMDQRLPVLPSKNSH